MTTSARPGKRPQATTFGIKPALALQMIKRALVVSLHYGWVSGNEVNGANRTLRGAQERRVQTFVLAVARTERV